jgi:hypothetical protein
MPFSYILGRHLGDGPVTLFGLRDTAHRGQHLFLTDGKAVHVYDLVSKVLEAGILFVAFRLGWEGEKSGDSTPDLMDCQ